MVTAADAVTSLQAGRAPAPSRAKTRLAAGAPLAALKVTPSKVAAFKSTVLDVALIVLFCKV